MKRAGLLAQTAHTVGSMAGNQGLQIAAGIAISRIYGPAGKGMVTYAGIAILGAVAIADGLSSAIARQFGTGDADAAAARAAALRIIVIVSLIVGLPLAALGAFIPAQRALLFVGIAFPFAVFVQTMSSFHLIALRVERTNFASLVINAGAATAMLIATLAARPPIEVIMAIWTAGYFVGTLIILPGLAIGRPEPSAVGAMLRAQLRFAVQASSASLMTFLAARIDVFIVASTLSAAALGNYTLALACGELMWQLGRAISWSAYGRVATAGFDLAADLAAKVTRIVLAVELLAALAAFVFGPAVLALVYGPAFAGAGGVLRILVFGMALYAADQILTYFIAVKVGRPALILRVEAATLVVCAAGSLLTVGRFGMLGPAVATTLAYLVSFSVKSALFVRSTGKSPLTLLLIGSADFRRPATDRAGSAVA